jgi:hypothetical protein
LNDADKLKAVRVQLESWDRITKGESPTTRPLWNIIGREDIVIEEPDQTPSSPGTPFRHSNGRLCIKQHSEGWAVIVESPDLGGPAKGKCALPHVFKEDEK